MVSARHHQNIGLNNSPERKIEMKCVHVLLTFHFPQQLCAGMRKNLFTGKLFDLPRTPLILLNCVAVQCRAVAGIYWMTFICWLAPGRQFHQEPSFCTPRTIILSNPLCYSVPRCWCGNLTLTEQRPGPALLCIKGLGIHETDKEHFQKRISRDYLLLDNCNIESWNEIFPTNIAEYQTPRLHYHFLSER